MGKSSGSPRQCREVNVAVLTEWNVGRDTWRADIFTRLTSAAKRALQVVKNKALLYIHAQKPRPAPSGVTFTHIYWLYRVASCILRHQNISKKYPFYKKKWIVKYVEHSLGEAELDSPPHLLEINMNSQFCRFVGWRKTSIYLSTLLM